MPRAPKRIENGTHFKDDVCNWETWIKVARNEFGHDIESDCGISDSGYDSALFEHNFCFVRG